MRAELLEDLRGERRRAGDEEAHEAADLAGSLGGEVEQADVDGRDAEEERRAEVGIVDSDGSLTRWLDKKGASVVVVRPDGFVYAGANQDQPLPAPPAGFKS